MELYHYWPTLKDKGANGWNFYVSPASAEDEEGNPVAYRSPEFAVMFPVDEDHPHIVCWTVYRTDYRKQGPTFACSDWETKAEAEAEAERLQKFFN